jgi:hypothetical protein
MSGPNRYRLLAELGRGHVTAGAYIRPAQVCRHAWVAHVCIQINSMQIEAWAFVAPWSLAQLWTR